MMMTINERKQAILNVLSKRKERGSDHQHLENYISHMKNVWKNNFAMLLFLNSIDLNKLNNNTKDG